MKKLIDVTLVREDCLNCQRFNPAKLSSYKCFTPQCPVWIPRKLSEVRVGDFVKHQGDSGFTHDSITEVIKITKRYDEKTGEPYRVIQIKGGQKFNANNGAPLTPPFAYYITMK